MINERRKQVLQTLWGKRLLLGLSFLIALSLTVTATPAMHHELISQQAQQQRHQSFSTTQTIVLSADGISYFMLKDYLEKGLLSRESGIGYLAEKGVFVPSTVTTPSVTAPSHIAIATGSIAAKNDITTNNVHLIRSPFEENLSGFLAPIGGYDTLNPHGNHDHAHGESFSPTSEPIWVTLRKAGHKVVAATFPGTEGQSIVLPGVEPPIVVQENDVRTADFTLPYGTFAGIGATGFSLSNYDFDSDPTQAIAGLNDLGRVFFGEVKVAELEIIEGSTIAGGSNQDYALQVAAIDTTDDGMVNYDDLVVFDANRGIEGPSELPSTGSAFLAETATYQPFFFEESHFVVGAGFILTHLTEDLSSVRLIRTALNYIRRPEDNPAVLETIDDIHQTVGFWAPQPDFRIPTRVKFPGTPGFNDFPDVELEAVYNSLVAVFTNYQTAVFLRALKQVPNASLALGYYQQPDGAEHQYWLTDPRQPSSATNATSIGDNQDPAVVTRFQQYIVKSYRTVSDAVQRVIDYVGVDEKGVPKRNILLISDHGFAPFHTAVNIDQFLVNSGFDPSEVRAIHTGPAVNIYINVAGREANGIVSPSRYPKLQRQIVAALEGLVDSNPVYTRGNEPISIFDSNQIHARPVADNPTLEEIITSTNDFIGPNGGDVFAVMGLGYNFDGFQAGIARVGDPESVQDIFSVPSFLGTHGYDPNLPEMQTVFVAAGPDFSEEVLSDLTSIRTIDINPTILDVLNVEPANTVDGESMFNFSESKKAGNKKAD